MVEKKILITMEICNFCNSTKITIIIKHFKNKFTRHSVSYQLSWSLDEHLPFFLSLLQHFTAEGFPFYVNTVSSAIQRCLGNPRSAALIKRYPVVPSGIYR